MPFHALCYPTLEKYEQEEEGTEMTTTFECDYDKNPTSLYEAIEERAWVAGFHFFKTGEWERGLFFAPVLDPILPERQAKTWVTRFESDGKVRWSQLPIHASIIFGAPFQFVHELIKIYPQGVRCTDDQHMLPLHLAMKYNADDCILTCLLEAFPEAIFTKDIRGRLPTEIESERKDRSQIMEQIIAVMAKTLTRRHGEAMHKNISELKDDLVLQNNLNMELERDKTEMEEKWKRAQEEIKILHENLEALQHQLESKNVIGAKKRAADQERALKAIETRALANRRAARLHPPSSYDTTDGSKASEKLASSYEITKSAFSQANGSSVTRGTSTLAGATLRGDTTGANTNTTMETREPPNPEQPATSVARSHASSTTHSTRTARRSGAAPGNGGSGSVVVRVSGNKASGRHNRKDLAERGPRKGFFKTFTVSSSTKE